MSIRSIVAAPTATGWAGRYVHRGGHPDERVPLLLALHRDRYAGSTDAMVRDLINAHPHGWSVLPSPGRPDGWCYCHHGQADGPALLTDRDADPLWHEAVYLLHPDRLEVIPARADGTGWQPARDLAWLTVPQH